jgi:metal-responsive CopG/Arc/MetJ family transcriptional regulator
MHKTTTLRLPERLLKEINEFIEEAHLERSAYLREIIRKGFELDKRERVLER